MGGPGPQSQIASTGTGSMSQIASMGTGSPDGQVRGTGALKTVGTSKLGSCIDAWTKVDTSEAKISTGVGEKVTTGRCRAATDAAVQVDMLPVDAVEEDTFFGDDVS